MIDFLYIYDREKPGNFCNWRYLFMKKKTDFINIRVSEEEKQLIKERANSYHQTISGYLLYLAIKEAKESESK